MPDVWDWSTTPANNNAASPDGFKEGMNRPEVNNSARQMMAEIALLLRNELPWLNLSKAATGFDRLGDATLRIDHAGVDYTSIYEVNRRIQVVGATTAYGLITVSAYASSQYTNLTVTWDSSGVTPTSITAVSVLVVDADSMVSYGGASGTGVGVFENHMFARRT